MEAIAYWCSGDFDSLLIEEWQGEFAVYQPASERTHFLNSLGMQILADLRYSFEAAAAEDEIAASLADRLQLQITPTFRAELHTILRRFDELGLITQVEKNCSRAG